MKKRNKKRAEMNSENVTQLDPASGPSNSELQFNVSHPLSGPRPVAPSTFIPPDPGIPAHMPRIAANGETIQKSEITPNTITGDAT